VGGACDEGVYTVETADFTGPGQCEPGTYHVEGGGGAGCTAQAEGMHTIHFCLAAGFSGSQQGQFDNSTHDSRPLQGCPLIDLFGPQCGGGWVPARGARAQ
jgi:hypothetical protein